jgi:hypothetical protein
VTTTILSQDMKLWVAFLKMYATGRCSGIQTRQGGAGALLLFKGPKQPLGFPTLAIDLEFVLNHPRESVREAIARKLIVARREFKRRPS